MMENLTPQEKDGVKAFMILAGVLYAGLIYYNVQFLSAELKQDQTKIADLQTQITEKEARLAEMKAMAANMDEVRRKQAMLAQVVKRLPKTADPRGFYLALEPVLQATHFEYSELQPQPPATRTAYTEIPYRIIGKSRYHDLGQYMNMIEENPDRLMRIKSFNITNQTERPSIHPVSVDIASFMFNPRG